MLRGGACGAKGAELVCINWTRLPTCNSLIRELRKGNMAGVRAAGSWLLRSGSHKRLQRLYSRNLGSSSVLHGKRVALVSSKIIGDYHVTNVVQQ